MSFVLTHVKSHTRTGATTVKPPGADRDRSLLWPFPRGSTTTYLLLGAAYQHTADRWSIAEGESEPGGRVEFPAGFDCSRDPVSYVIRRWLPLYGVGLDSSRDARFFYRWQYRARLYPSLGDLRIGVGVRF